MTDLFTVPESLQEGTPLTKVSESKHKQYTFRIDPDQGQILWNSSKGGIIPIESIKEIRSGANALYYLTQFSLPESSLDRFLTIIYILSGTYETLHILAPTRDVLDLWDATVRKLYAVRQGLMSGLGNIDMRETIWERMYWTGADEEKDNKLDFDDVERMCLRMNVNSSREALRKLFDEADIEHRNYLDFSDFQRFVKLLKKRPELETLYDKVCAANDGIFDFPTFESFMRDSQESKLSREELQVIFLKYVSMSPNTGQSLASAASSPPQQPTPQGTSTMSAPPTLSLAAFTTFLLSSDNTVFPDQTRQVYHDMTRPISEYYISASHNTYLVGHQLVGVSTIEGYIRALLHSCRSVELDIYDSTHSHSPEPTIFHGKTLTSAVPLRAVCQAIAKYAFVTSPFPVIISAEVHCGLEGQEMIVKILTEVFGDALVQAPVEGRQKIEVLPSPEALKGKVLLKAKNLYVAAELASLQTSRAASMVLEVESDSGSESDTETTSGSSSDTDILDELKGLKSKLRKVRGKDGPSSATGAGAGNTPAPASATGSLSRPSSKAELKATWKKVREKGSSSSLSCSGSEFAKAELKELKKDITKDLKYGWRKVRGKEDHHSPSASVTSLLAPSPAPALPQTSSAAASPIPSPSPSPIPTTKPKMSLALASLLVYTVGVKCRGLAASEEYAPEHIFSLSETKANKFLKEPASGADLIRHNQTHVVRIYPKGLRVNSTNYEPHRYWAAGAQVAAINWQTFDLGYMINQAMFQRNGRSGYVLKPLALRGNNQDLLAKRTKHFLDVTIISAQQLPRLRDSKGQEIIDKSIVDPYVEVSLHIPDWTQTPFLQDPSTANPGTTTASATTTSDSAPTPTPPAPVQYSPPSDQATKTGATATSARTVSFRTPSVKDNGFNPVWQEELCLPFDCVGDMLDLVFVQFSVRQEGTEGNDKEPLAVYCASLGSLEHGFRHLPLHDSQLSQYLFSTLFVEIGVRDAP